MVIVAPFAELYVMPKLVNPFQAKETAQNILTNQSLFVSAIFSYLLTFTLDIVISWSLYILLKPVNKDLAMLTAVFRLIYAIIAIVALNNLITAFQLLTTSGYLELFKPDQVNNLAMVTLRAFKNHWYFGIIIFGIHLLLLGYMVYKSGYKPKILGIILMITGIGYLLTSMRPYLFPDVRINFAQYTFYGEILFMIWLLIRGYKIREPEFTTIEDRPKSGIIEDA
jgi:hypothetical protein